MVEYKDMEFKELPDDIRVKLDEEAEQQLWKTIEEFGGVKRFADSFDYSASRMYNWKNKDVFIPVGLVKQVSGNNASSGVIAIKGRGRSKPLRDPEFPLEENDELLTRISSSVYMNEEGVPVYQTDDLGLVDRFVELLQVHGDVPVKVYNRSVHEVRYPKYLHQILEQMSFEQDIPALVDEEGVIEDGKIILDSQVIDIDEFGGRLHSRSKRLELALARADSDEVASIMSEEAERIRGFSQGRDG